jgi:hypothetical protein
MYQPTETDLGPIKVTQVHQLNADEFPTVFSQLLAINSFVVDRLLGSCWLQSDSPNCYMNVLYRYMLLSLVTLKDVQVPKTVTYVRLEVFTAVTMKNGVFWDVTPCGSCKNRRFGGT